MPPGNGWATRARPAVGVGSGPPWRPSREEMAQVVDHLIATDDSDMHVMSMLRGEDLREALVDDAGAPGVDADPLAGPFAHVVVDEAQELTDAEWQMLLLRCPSRSFTVVGDRAQARHGFADVLAGPARPGRARPDRPGHAADQLPDARGGDGGGRAGHPGRRPRRQRADLRPQQRDPRRPRSTSELDSVLDTWLAANPDGIACVIGSPDVRGDGTASGR